jgi:hypothetical protein
MNMSTSLVFCSLCMSVTCKLKWNTRICIRCKFCILALLQLDCMSFYHFILSVVWYRAGIVQSVWRLPRGWMTKGSEFESQWGQEFSLLYVIQTSSGAHPAYCPMDTRDSFPWGKAAGREADRSPPTSAKVKKMWSIHPFPYVSSWHSA